MKTVKLTIDGRSITVPSGTSILDAARKANIPIPSLCFLDGCERFTSCMVCVVYDASADKVLPACSAVVAEGMRVTTDNAEVRDARRDALDFLLSEHVGDCEAPCQRACPAHMNIPLMIRQIEAGRFREAIQTIKENIPLPAVLGRICPAPCENACRRRSYDAAVSICSLKRAAADFDLAQESPCVPAGEKSTGQRVAVIGAGPTGLSAAFYTLRFGHACDVYDKNPLPGGMIRYGIPDDDLPKSVLDAEIQIIEKMGAVFLLERTLGENLEWENLRDSYDAVILAVGKTGPHLFASTEIKLSNRGILIDKKTFQTSSPGVFAGGNAVFAPSSPLAIRSVAQGKEMAFAVNQFLNGEAVAGTPPRFLSTVGRIRENEFLEYLKEACDSGRVSPINPDEGYTEKEVIEESRRCFGCDCRKPDSCRLRTYAEEYQASLRRFPSLERQKIQKNIQHEKIVFEPGKCIKCGLCVQITRKSGEKFGLAFVNRGFDVRVQASLSVPLAQAIQKSAGPCVAACPTGALSWKERIETALPGHRGIDHEKK